MRGRNTVLIVDDMEVNRAILSSLFEHEYDILEAANGAEALNLLMEYHDSIAVMLLDIVMPIKDGFQVLQEMNATDLLSSVPVIVITTEDSSESEVRSFDLGAVDIVMKPFEPHVVKRRIKNIIELYRHKLHLEELVEEQAHSLRESNEVLVDALSSVIEHRSLESGQHILRIRMFTKILLQNVAELYEEYSLDRAKIDLIASSAAMHDVGKIAIPDSILNKPGKLTTEEFAIMKTHTTKGCEILEGLGRMNDKEYLQYAYDICRYHHERWDGRGYPDGLKGDSIPICAQVAGIADAYDALTTDRVYKKAYTHEKARDMILNGECGCFSPKLLQCFENVDKQFKDLSREYGDGRSPHQDMFTELNTKPMNKTVPIRHGALMEKEYLALIKYMRFTVFELDLTKDRYDVVHVADSVFDGLQGGKPFLEDFRQFALQEIHPDDHDRAESELMAYGRAESWRPGRAEYGEYLIMDRSSDEYRRYRVSMIYLNTDVPKALLVWKDLKDEEAVKSGGQEETIDQADNGAAQPSNDILTGLPNKTAIKQEIERFLEEKNLEKNHALFIIDVDDFKNINESYGHLAGDDLLKRVSECVISQFRTDDIIGRVGGDEFVVFLKNVADNSFIHRIASSLIWELNKVFAGADRRNHVTVSIGIARFPVDGLYYDDLYKKADLALYSAKRCGKDQWQIYKEEHGRSELPENFAESYSLRREWEKQKHQTKSYVTELVEQIIQMFFELNDEDKTIKVALDMVARHYHLHHIYVYLEDALGRMKKMFDWRADSVTRYYNFPQLIERNVQGELLQEYFNADGIFVCPDTQGIRGKIGEDFRDMELSSVLCATIHSNGKSSGYIGFSAKEGPYKWSEEEIQICQFLAKLIDLIYIKRQSVRKLEKINQLYNMLFDKIDVESYVIDESFEIIKVNQKIKECHDVERGEKCYRSLRKQEHPCQECPVMQLSKSCHNYSAPLYITSLKQKYQVTACDLGWENPRKAFLITCRELQPEND